MKKNSFKKKALPFIISYLIFTGLTYFFNTVLSTFDITGVRFSAALSPVLGIIWGWPAILGCAFGNMTCGLLCYGTKVFLLGIIPQIFCGAFPFYIWKKISRGDSHLTRLDSPGKTVSFALLMLIDSFLIGLSVGYIQYAVTGHGFWSAALFAFIDDFDMCLIIGLPIMAIMDFYYFNLLHSRKRLLSVNEKITLWSCVLQLVCFTAICIVSFCLFDHATTRVIWKNIFIWSGYAVNVILLLSVSAMLFFAYLKKKNSGLRIIQKTNGTLFVDEKKHLEFVSFPAQELSCRVKSDALGYTYENARSQTPSSYENAWYISLSSQKGCLMKCAFCDCPGLGFYGNVSSGDFNYQLDTVFDNCGSTHTKRLEVDFMRMGEPSLNPDILNYIEFSLKEQVVKKVNADVIYPTISTMLPRTQKDIAHFLQEFCRIKNDVYGGGADLQFSINTTDESKRKHIFRNMALSLPEISEICKTLPSPKGRKYALSFAVTQDTIIDERLIDSLFDKDKFLIKLTPIHNTFNAAYNGFEITTEYSDYDVFESFEKRFTDIGWDVMVYLDKQEEDDDALTCGNLLLSNIPDRISSKISKKKKIGILVAIELNAIYKMYDNPKELYGPDGFKLLQVEKENFTIYILQCGMGEIAASAGTQYLISNYHVAMVVNFGVVGGLTSDMKKQKVCLVNRVVHYKYDCSEFLDLAIGQVDGHDSIFLRPDENLIKNAQSVMEESLSLVTCCSGDKFIGTSEEKTHLHNSFDGDICDMESAGIVLTCEANQIPCILFKAVSDGLNDGAAGFFAELESASLRCLEIADKIMEKIAHIES